MAASRAFVCVRLATYENKEEGAFLETIFRGRTGALENTTFALLGPDGTQRLSRAGRGPAALTGNRPPRPDRRGGPPPDAAPDPAAAKALADLLVVTSKRFRPRAALSALPQSLDFRRALNVAACDNQPLVVVKAKSDSQRKRLEVALARLAWRDAYVGRFHYAVVEGNKALKAVNGVPAGDGVFVVAPDAYGLGGRVIAEVSGRATSKQLEAVLTKADEVFEPIAKSRRAHVRKGRRAGKAWESEIPVTDPHARRADQGR